MNFPFFIANRVAASGQASFARLIIRIAIAAVAVSICVMILAMALIKGFKSEISTKMFGFWGHIHIMSAQTTTTYEPVPINAAPDFLPTLRTLTDIPLVDTEGGDIVKKKNAPKGTKEIHHVQAFAQKPGIIKTETDFEGIILKGYGSDFDDTFIKNCLVDGNLPDFKADSMPNKILLSQSTANRLRVKTNDKFVVHFVQNNTQQQRLFQVSGIYKTGLEEYDRKIAIVDIRQVQELLGWKHNQIAGFEVFVTNLDDVQNTNNYIYNELITNDLTCQTIREEQPAIFDWLDLQDVNEQVILSLMLVVGIINMVTALLILILERTNMIGILKSLGSSNFQIQKVFLYYGAIVTVLGLLIGNMLGLGLGFLQKKFNFIKLSEADYYLAYAPIKFDFQSIIFLNIGSFLLIVATLFLPSLLVMTISPVKAIRFK